MAKRSCPSTLDSLVALNSSSIRGRHSLDIRSGVVSILNSSAIVSLLWLCLTLYSGNRKPIEELSSARHSFWENRSRVQADWHFQAEQITRVPACSPKPTRKGNADSPDALHIQTVIFQRGDPIANRHVKRLLICSINQNPSTSVRFSTFSVFLIGGFGKVLGRFESQLFLAEFWLLDGRHSR